jgi:group I intron endonuclease
MTKIGYIYKITSPTGKIYIGKTTRLNDRITKYRNCNGISEQKIIYNSIKKHGWENHIFEVVTEAPIDQLSYLESFYIETFNSFQYSNPNGMNLTKGGEGTPGRKDSIETKNKRANSIRGRHHSEQTKQLMSELKKGKPSNNKGIPCSDEKKKKISVANTGKHKPASFYIKKHKTLLEKLIRNHESILQIDPITNNLIKEWIEIPTYISTEMKIDCTSLRHALSKKYKTAGGFIWKYKKETP